MKKILKISELCEERERIKNEKEKNEGKNGETDINEKIKLNEDYLYDVIN